MNIRSSGENVRLIVAIYPITNFNYCCELNMRTKSSLIDQLTNE